MSADSEHDLWWYSDPDREWGGKLIQQQELEPPELYRMTPAQRYSAYLKAKREGDFDGTFGEFLRWCYGSPEQVKVDHSAMKQLAAWGDEGARVQ